MSWADIPGWTDRRLLELYDELARDLPVCGTFVEIGVAYGRSLAYFVEACKRRPDLGMQGIRILGIDVWDDFMGGDNLPPAVFERLKAYKTPFKACIGELKAHAPECYGRITLHKTNGVLAALAHKDESVDAVFIDDEHTYASVRGAIEAWLPKVKSGGWLCGHDANEHYPGVWQAVEEKFPSAELRPPYPEADGWGGTWIWRKP